MPGEVDVGGEVAMGADAGRGAGGEGCEEGRGEVDDLGGFVAKEEARGELGAGAKALGREPGGGRGGLDAGAGQDERRAGLKGREVAVVAA